MEILTIQHKVWSVSYPPQQQVAVIHHSYISTTGNHEVVKKESQQESAYMTATGRRAGKHNNDLF